MTYFEEQLLIFVAVKFHYYLEPFNFSIITDVFRVGHAHNKQHLEGVSAAHSNNTFVA